MKTILFYGLTLLVVSLFAYLFIKDWRGGSLDLKRTSSRIRLTSVLLMLFLSALDLARGPGRVGAESPLLNMAASGFILQLSPRSYPKRKQDRSFPAALSFSAVCLAVSAVLASSRAPELKNEASALMTVCGLVLYNGLCLKEKYANLRSLFLSDSVRHSIGDYASHCYSILLLSALCLSQIAAVAASPLSILLSLLCAVLLSASVYGAYRQSADKTIVFLSPGQRFQIDTLLSGRTAEKSVRSKSRMALMFDKILKHMAENHPYLREKYSIRDLADDMLSNRVYVSNTINKQFGDNYRNFINKYRVEYSQMLWKMNPKLQAQELYSRCGFHNMVSFINAFRTATGYTPVEWLKETQAEKLSGAKPVEKDLAA